MSHHIEKLENGSEFSKENSFFIEVPASREEMQDKINEIIDFLNLLTEANTKK